MPSSRPESVLEHPSHLTRVREPIIHPRVTRSIIASIRCVLAAMLAITVVAARPSMMTSHEMAGMPHGCGMAMHSHHQTSTDHDCSSTTKDTCCDDCLCAGPIGSGAIEPVVVLVATYTHVVTVIDRPVQVVRSSRQPALRLPPPLGPPLDTRS